MDKYRPYPSIIAMFTSDSQHPPRSRHAVYLGVSLNEEIEHDKKVTLTPEYVTFRWRADGGQTLNAGLKVLWFYRGSGPILIRKPIFL